jgi:hypothetical protein
VVERSISSSSAGGGPGSSATFGSALDDWKKMNVISQALKEVNHMIMQKKVNWIIDADIKGFFGHTPTAFRLTLHRHA